MPLYEGRINAENKINVKQEWVDSVVIGPTEVCKQIAQLITVAASSKNGRLKVAFDGWYGVEWDKIIDELKKYIPTTRISFVNFNMVLKSIAEIDTYKKKYIGEDPSFGYANMEGKIADIVDRGKLARLKKNLVANKKEIIILFNSGASSPDIAGEIDLKFYFDYTRQPLLWKMWDGRLIPFAYNMPNKNYNWKEYYYCDFYLLEHQKQFAYSTMDFYLEAINFDELKLVPRAAYDVIMQTLIQYPVKEVEIYQPGPWGAYRYKDFWDIPGLECNAWNELAGPELSMLVNIGSGKILNMPFVNLMQYDKKLLGTYIPEHFPGLFPMDIWLDDGYFPEPTPAERISMPIHNHPGTHYVKKHFNEPIGRYETYYIVEAYEGANTWMGFKDDADTEEWERKCYESWDKQEPIPDWKNYIKNWKSNVGDLYLIPPGTTHGHGGNQMVLEMDTVPSIAGTEYSFFMYDFMRPSWDDTTKTMTGKPVKMHLDHGFDMDQTRREDWVEKHLRAKAEIVKWTKEYFIDRYSSYGPMPFEIERIHFYKRGEYNTEGKFCNILTLTIGKNVIIRSKSNPDYQADINLFQSAVIPACFGDYEVINTNEGFCTLTLIRWKKG
ncbi:MAG: hypothetical protein JXB49_18375 [Bacteroidales bacterium]|nr:hypothetical protein [Bacteroidales bacterium]